MNSRETIVDAPQRAALKSDQCWVLDDGCCRFPRLTRRTKGVSSRLLALVLSAGLCASTSPQASECAEFTPYGQPTHASIAAAVGADSPPDRTVICHAGQVVAFNPKRNVSDWSAYRLRKQDLLTPKVSRKDNFRPDPSVAPSHRVVRSDYTRTGFDRGHLAPAAAMLWSFDAMNDSFFMTNIAPQVGAGFNQHIWKSLETKMRQWACDRGALHVVTGPLYERRPVRRLVYDRDGDGDDDNGVLVDVPTHFFKLAFDPGRAEAIAFILENRRLKTADLPKYLTSIDEVEARSRLDFLPALWDAAEAAVESHVQPALWARPGGECGGLR